MEIKSISIALIFVAIMTILVPSIVGVGEMADNKDDDKGGWIKKIMKNDNWHKKILDFFNFKKLTGFMNSENSSTEESDSEDFSSEDFNSGGFSSGDVFAPSHVCGNGRIDTDSQSTETCEPPNTATCDSNCHLKKFCGDGIINQPSEQCEPPNTATCDASCKFKPDDNFEHAYIDLELSKIHVDPNGEPDSGDEYFDNLITECSFHSDDTITGKVCLTCLIVDEKMEPCEDIFLNFLDFDDGQFEDDINAANLGFTVKGVAASGMLDGLYVWNPNLDHISIGDTNPPNTEDDDIENDGPAGFGDCTACDNFNMLIFADDENNDNIPEPMDDSASGGIVTITLDSPKHWASFDIVDIENDQNAVATAYSNTLPNGDCDPQSIIKVVPIPPVNNAQVQTVVVNADNVSCLTVKYHDSGGLTNFDFRCIKKMNADGVLSEGKWELPNGYVGSTHLSIPLDPGVDVQKAVGVRIKSQCEVPPQENCVCDKPDTFTVEYNGPTMDKVVISGSHGSFAINGPITSGFDIVATGPLLNSPSGKMPPNTTYDFYKGTNKKGSITIHTSCSQPLFVGQMFTVQTSLGQIKLTVVSGTLNGVPSIPDASCPNIPREIFNTSFEDTAERANWVFDASRSGVPMDGPQKLEILDQSTSDPALAHTGTRYLGGSGDFDPQFAAYNRVIDVSAYHDVQVSLWYSAEDTESADDFALYYKDGLNWIVIKDVPNSEHNVSSSQLSWQNVVTSIPDTIDTLVIQFRWYTSSGSEHMMLDDLVVTGILNP